VAVVFSGLFMQDFLMFVQEVKAGASSEPDQQRAIHCLELSDQLNAFMGLSKE